MVTWRMSCATIHAVVAGLGSRTSVALTHWRFGRRYELGTFDAIGYLKDIQSQGVFPWPPAAPSTRSLSATAPQTSATGVTRDTAKRLAESLGVDETQAIHLALHDMAVKLLPQYEADESSLAAAQIRQIKKRVPQGKKKSVRSSLFEVEPA